MDRERMPGSPEQPSHPVFDSHEGTWYCRVRNDLSEMDTMPLKFLPVSAISKPEEAPAQPTGGDPYNRGDPEPTLAGLKAARRTLDDMRKLSEEIKRLRAGTQSSET
jgi:hypothetical protein